MRDPENILLISSLLPDYLGLIFYPGSDRYVNDPDQLVDVLSQPRTYRLTGVFVNEKLETILDLHAKLSFDAVQLHGEESPELCDQIRNKGLTVIKAIGVANEKDLIGCIQYRDQIDYFLFDTKTDTQGGSGIKFDWKILLAYDEQIPFLLAGGIQPKDMSFPDHPYFAGVDLNSQFEDQPAIKNYDKLKVFVEEFRK